MYSFFLIHAPSSFTKAEGAPGLNENLCKWDIEDVGIKSAGREKVCEHRFLDIVLHHSGSNLAPFK